MRTFALPDLGEGLAEAEVVTWHVSSGDHVVTDQPLVSVETAKAVVEIPSPWSGNISRLLVDVGDVIEIGDDMVEFDTEARIDQGAIVGEIPDQAAESGTDSDDHSRITVKASPAVRKLAAEQGIDLSTIVGTGPEGAILTKDLEQHLIAVNPDTASSEPVRGVRRTMAKVMARAGAEVVPASVTEEADLSRWNENENVMVRLIRAMQSGVEVEPGLNAWYYPETGQRKLQNKFNPGIAVDSVDGLFVPVIRNVEDLSDRQILDKLEKIRADVSSRKVLAEDMRDQSITLSNFGMIGGIHATLVVVPPQVAILGVGRKVTRPVAVGSEVANHPLLPLSLTFDHRVVTGGEAARFLSAVVTSLEKEQHGT